MAAKARQKNGVKPPKKANVSKSQVETKEAMMLETYEQQTKDSDTIFTAINTGNFDNYEQAQQAVCLFYVPDRSISRAGISHALGRLKKFYQQRAQHDTEA